ncbi:unnamed protein product, partial [Closterium sp. NIES-54]
MIAYAWSLATATVGILGGVSTVVFGGSYMAHTRIVQAKQLAKRRMSESAAPLAPKRPSASYATITCCTFHSPSAMYPVSSTPPPSSPSPPPNSTPPRSSLTPSLPPCTPSPPPLTYVTTSQNSSPSPPPSWLSIGFKGDGIATTTPLGRAHRPYLVCWAL